MSINVILVGPAGCGKSTITNTLVGQIVSSSGPSFNGSGVTRHIVKHAVSHGQLRGHIIVDTPGYNDLKLHATAAAEIKKALNSSKIVKILVLATMEAGRTRPSEQAFINSLISALGGKCNYCVLFNKTSPSSIINSPAHQRVLSSFYAGLTHPPSSACFIPFDPQLAEKKNSQLQLSSKAKLESFISSLPTNEVTSVGEILSTAEAQNREKQRLEQEKMRLEREKKEAEAKHRANVEAAEAHARKQKKKGKVVAGVAAGAVVAGPVGAIVGGLLGSLF
mmetsp:Transcript_11364/g.22294  ORF Transcript_11364/g.22294 Transcript_11364/m.22294 type:complete len:279 (-) Transcript_11364:165-1001(-)